ncbi:MAG: DUF1573 domain-containing protein [Melioribacteraceae bacterium]|nr:DUF1573 domain-containing protein [Melioribacteraceae bacterium]
MKRIKFVIVMFISAFTANVIAQTTLVVDTENAPVMTFVKTSHDFGTINEGDRVETDFEFTNTGKSALLITRIKASCGCTVPSGWTKEPILPGETSKFTVRFNSTNKPNKQRKSVTVTCNTVKGKEVVRFTAQVIPDPELAKARAERAAKRKEQYALRKLEQQKKAAALKAEKKPEVEKKEVKKEVSKEVKKSENEVVNSEKEVKKALKETKEVDKEVKKSEKKIKKENKKDLKFEATKITKSGEELMASLKVRPDSETSCRLIFTATMGGNKPLAKDMKDMVTDILLQFCDEKGLTCKIVK